MLTIYHDRYSFLLILCKKTRKSLLTTLNSYLIKITLRKSIKRGGQTCKKGKKKKNPPKPKFRRTWSQDQISETTYFFIQLHCYH